MREREAFEHAVVRVVPRMERGECLNAGVVVICRARRYLAARVGLDRARLAAFAPWLDVPDLAAIEANLALIPRICAADPASGPIAALSLSERWHWLTVPASTIVQPGPVHTGLCPDPAAALDRLFATLVLATPYDPDG